MELLFVNLYPSKIMGKYLLSSYVLKAALQKNLSADIHIEIINFDNAESEDVILEHLRRSGAECIGYSCYLWNVSKIVHIAQRLRQGSDVPQVFGGPEITEERVRHWQWITPKDFFVPGEGERKMGELIDSLGQGEMSCALLPEGIVWTDGKDLHFKKEKVWPVPLDEIPSIYLDGVIEDQLYARQQAFLETQRGCRYKCAYCIYHKGFHSISYYSLERIKKELKFLIIDKQIAALRIFDAVFTSDLARAKRIVRYLIELKKDVGHFPMIYWEFNYFDTDDEFLELLAELKTREEILNSSMIGALDRPQHYAEMLKGYSAINCVGVQSFNAASLKAVSRPSGTKEKFERFMEKARVENIALKLDLILGLPEETMGSYLAGLEYLLPFLESTDHILNIHVLQVLPGTEIEGLAKKYSLDYNKEAPYFVKSTQTMMPLQMIQASRVSAVLFRVVNSPLRPKFFAARESAGCAFAHIAEGLVTKILENRRFGQSALCHEAPVDDLYWNDAIFEEIPTDWLSAELEKY